MSDMIFRKRFVRPILATPPKKTVARRPECRWHLGEIVEAKTSHAAEAFARIRIKSIGAEHGPGTYADCWGWARGTLKSEALKEGFRSWRGLVRAYEEIYGEAAPKQPCYRIEFEVVR